MKRRAFGPTGYEVSEIGLGGMPLSLEGRPDEADGVRVIHAALDAGVRLVDTADVYCIDDRDIGHNERLIARALREWNGPAREVLVATKGGLVRPDGAWETNGRPEHLAKACNASLAALGVERIAVYQLHAPDDDVPLADSVGALARLRDAGKIEHVGLSNVTVAELDEASAIVPIVSVQNRCNPHDLRAFRDGILAACEKRGLAFLPYSPVGGGRQRSGLGRDPALTSVGARHGATAYEIALAWLLAKSPAMIPIPGASKIANAISSARASDITLSSADLAEIDRAVGLG
jgi:aryl-alcohol dehydrogenase-like predicted oxidoreductase